MTHDFLPKLIGQTVEILVSDPWEFGTEVGTGPFLARIEKVFSSRLIAVSESTSEERILLHLDKPFGYNGLKCEYLIASSRLAGEYLAVLAVGNIAATNFVRVSQIRAEADDPFGGQISDERSFSLIGSVRAV